MTLLLPSCFRSAIGDLLKRGVTLALRCDRASLQRLRALLDAVSQGATLLASASLSAAVFAAAAAASIVRSSGVTLCREELLERRHSSPAPASGELLADAAAVLPRTCSTACQSSHAHDSLSLENDSCSQQRMLLTSSTHNALQVSNECFISVSFC
jgi:hypothetical protein